jgi:hypothetical protein
MTMTKAAILRAGTRVAASKTRSDIERVLAKFGAVGFSFSVNHEQRTAVVEFVMPAAPGSTERVPVKLPVNVRRVYEILFGKPHPKVVDEGRWEQAERVAWRNVLVWVEAALSAVACGAQSVSEAFLAHLVVIDEQHGRAERFGDVIERAGGVLGEGRRLLLPTGGK